MTPDTAASPLDACVQDCLSEECGLEDGTPITVACSGGGDSVGLAHLLQRSTERWPMTQVLFVDHGTRDVTAEARSSRLAAERASVPWRRLEVILSGSGNLQAQARAKRYEALLAATPNGTVLATGHTMDDQAETVIQRLLRGSGLRGLTGIRARDERVVRPLLRARREDLRRLELPFSDDPSNATGRFLRNRIRHDVMPLLERENPRAIEALAVVASQAAGEQALLAALLGRLESVDPDLRGLEPKLVTTWLRWWLDGQQPAIPASRTALADFAERLVGGTDGRTSLGAGRVGVSDTGQASLSVEDDPRRKLVAAAVGVYVMEHVTLHVGAESGPCGDEAPAQMLHAWLEHDDVQWPLTLRREHGRGQKQGRLKWQLQDGAGREVRLDEGPSARAPNEYIVPFVVELVVR